MMRVLLVHPERQYFAGAETMLLYFINGLAIAPCEVVVATVEGSRLANLIPDSCEQLHIPDKSTFSIRRLRLQLSALMKRHQASPFDVIHGWAARDWELTALVGRCLRRPAIGTLHDHPASRFISWKRRCLMRWCARWGLQKIVCVSEAVRSACVACGYSTRSLEVVHNGLPAGDVRAGRHPRSIFRMGYLGAFSERKGLYLLFAMLAELARQTDASWELHVAGHVQDAAGKELLDRILQSFNGATWWSRVNWIGWTNRPLEFLETVDLLLVPSVEFDPFPTVLLEAAKVGVPVLATRVGGVPEIVDENSTGWLFDPRDPHAAASILRGAIENPGQCRRFGAKAQAKVAEQFSTGKMVAKYMSLYSTLRSDG
jgi:glycosyltransferase involved in cell wall biosynthesis